MPKIQEFAVQQALTMTVSDTGWIQSETSHKGNQERTLVIPSSDPNLPNKIRLHIFQIHENGRKRRWRAHASINSSELFRLFAPTLKKAQEQTEAELRDFAAAILAAFK